MEFIIINDFLEEYIYANVHNKPFFILFYEINESDCVSANDVNGYAKFIFDELNLHLSELMSLESFYLLCYCFYNLVHVNDVNDLVHVNDHVPSSDRAHAHDDYDAHDVIVFHDVYVHGDHVHESDYMEYANQSVKLS